MAATSERLPWLDDDPAPGSVKPGPKKSTGKMWPWYLLLLLVVGAVAAGAYWLLSQGREAPPPELPAEQSLPIPVTEADPLQPSSEAVAEEVATTSNEMPQPVTARRVTSPAQSGNTQRVAPITYDAGQDEETSGTRSIFPADEPAAAPPPPGPNPVVAYNPRPYSGRVVQLGAFPTRKQAEDTWKRVTRRYPYLTSKPKMVNTVDVRGLGGGRPTRMYRLQLGTSSQAQSVVICQQLERAGHSCVVVY